MPAKLSEDEKNALLAIHKHLACLKQSGFSHASIVVEQVLILLELPNVKIYLESISAALGNVVEFIQQKRRGAGWYLGVIIRDLERLTANLQQQLSPEAGQGVALPHQKASARVRPLDKDGAGTVHGCT